MTTILSIEQENTALKQQNEALREEIQQKKATPINHKLELNQLRKDLANAQQQLEQARIASEDRDVLELKELEIRTEFESNINALLDKLKEDNEGLTAEVSRLRAELAKQNERIKHYKATEQAQNDQVADLKQKFAEEKSDLKEKNALLTGQLAEVSQLIEKIELLQNEVMAVKLAASRQKLVQDEEYNALVKNSDAERAGYRQKMLRLVLLSIVATSAVNAGVIYLAGIWPPLG